MLVIAYSSEFHLYTQTFKHDQRWRKPARVEVKPGRNTRTVTSLSTVSLAGSLIISFSQSTQRAGSDATVISVQ